MLLFVASILLVILVAFVNLSDVPTGVEGDRDAYLTEVRHQATAYEGSNFTLSLVTYNRNCSSDIEGRAVFYFLFYLDGDLWWNEYNNTQYQTWSCKKESSVTRSFSVPTWYSIRPAVHDLKIVLYWYDGNVSRLQDTVSFPVSVAVHVDRDNLVIYSYVIICLAAVFVLGFYMTTIGPLPSAVPIGPQDCTSVSDKPTKRSLRSFSETRWQSFLPLFFFIFVSWQMTNVLPRAFSVPEQLFPYLFLTIQIVYVGLLVFLIRRENSSYLGYGFVWPEETKKYVAAILLLAASYTFVAVLLPGVLQGYNLFPPLSIAEIFSLILSTSVVSFASETIFRGYFQTKITELRGFPFALVATSVMFSLYALPLSPFDPSNAFLKGLFLFFLGLFLGILYYRTKTLLCPMIFSFAISVINPLMSVEAATAEYSRFLLQLSALGLSSLLLFILTLKTGREILDQEIVCGRSLS